MNRWLSPTVFLLLDEGTDVHVEIIRDADPLGHEQKPFIIAETPTNLKNPIVSVVDVPQEGRTQSLPAGGREQPLIHPILILAPLRARVNQTRAGIRQHNQPSGWIGYKIPRDNPKNKYTNRYGRL